MMQEPKGPASQRQSADTVYNNGNILTMASDSIVEAVAVADGKILATGSLAAMRSISDEKTAFIDLQGKTMLPGFIDAHSHFIDNAVRIPWVNLNSKPLGPVTSIEDMLRLLQQRAEQTPRGQWIIGWGYDDTNIREKRHPERDDLDRVSREHPVVIQHISGWATTSNSLALQLTGIDEKTQDTSSIVFHRNGSGTLTGVIKASCCPVLKRVPRMSREAFLKAIEAGSAMYLAKGCTTAQEGWVDHPEWFPLMHEALRCGRLGLRLVLYPFCQDLSLDEYARTFPDPPSGSSLDAHHRLIMGAIKLSVDGSIQAYTAFLSQPYYHCPAGQPGYVGYPSNNLNTFRQYVLAFHRMGRQLAVHCNGDAAIDIALDAYEEAQCLFPRNDARFIIIHSQMARIDQIERMARLKVIPSFFIAHTYFWGDRHYEIFMGPERAVRMSPAGDALRQGIPFTLHNDTYVTPFDPLMLVWSAVNRLSSSGRDLGRKEQGIPVLDALRGITINAARQGFEEQVKGSIEPGKFADFAVLEENPLTVNPLHIKDIGIAATIMNGKLVYGNLTT